MKPSSLAPLLLLLLPVAGQGAIVAQYNFDSDFASSDAEPLTSAGVFLSQATGTFAGEFGVLGTPAGASSQTAAWSARSLPTPTRPGSAWFDFTIGLDPSVSEISFSSLDFTAYVFHTIGGTTAFNYELFWSVDGFGSPIASANGPSISGGGSLNDSEALSFDLSALPAQTTDVTFRFDPVLAPGSDGNGGGAVETSQRGGAVDNLVLNATVSAVPLPPTPLLLAAGAVLLARQAGRPRLAAG
ncbi:hypothetical protein [uncultured Thiohalocapsa sp.]|uniref:hypothetical protein n=1 Tax=uncultured Thiohalocapsa sp. TaxID=768990 RepID=UPI0025DCD6AC|nr:hypothetical protein [uncultured Thiohalocapsa sp.]